MIEISIRKRLRSATGEMLLDLTASLKPGSFTTLYGKSGAGKTTTLKIISGLTSADEGSIIVNGNKWVDTKINIDLPPQKRAVGLLFQDYSLFPHMTVRQNLEFALYKNQPKKIISELIDIIELGDLQHRKPDTLSGGQQQRVALARALVQRPDILMLDEPLSALDNDMRIKLQEYITRVHRAYGLTTIMISHDISEILRMSDSLIEIDQGKVIRRGLPEEIFGLSNVGSGIQCIGDIMSIENQGDFLKIRILSGLTYFNFNFPISKMVSFKIGDRVIVNTGAVDPEIKKIQT